MGAQGALMAEREREAQVERATLDARDARPQSHLASARRRSEPVGAAVATWLVGAAAFVAALAGRNHSAEAAHLAQLRLSRRRPTRRR